MDYIYLILMFIMFLGISLSLIAQEIVADKDDNCDDNEQEYKITDDMVFITINNQKMASDVTSGDFYITEYVKMSDKTVLVSTSRNKVTQDYIILTGSTSKNIELTQEFDDSGKPVIFSGDIKLIEQNPPDYKLYEITIPEKEN